MAYPKIPDYANLIEQLRLYGQLKYEYGSKEISPILKKAEKSLKQAIVQIKKLPVDKSLAKKEPNELSAICKLRPKGSRKIWKKFNKGVYEEKLEGAFLGRVAGCLLGAAVEFWSIEKMEALAKGNGDEFPPVDYWKYIPEPAKLHCNIAATELYSRKKMNAVQPDDDIMYTLIGLLIVEEFGADFTTADVGRAWVKYLPIACTAEEVALNNLKKGIAAEKAAEINNPYCEWIGADIRSDPWAYMWPGQPEAAAEFAYRDAYLSHRRQGIYGEMFFAAAISAAFAVDEPLEAIRVGLTEIPKDCALAKAVKWALKVSPGIKNYKQAREAMDEKFEGMHPVHTINNACLTIWGLAIGGTDFTKVISETVAMGMDNDCTAATAGSIVGAIVGKKGIPRHWYKNFNNTVVSYLIGKKQFTISDLVKRFSRQAKRNFS